MGCYARRSSHGVTRLYFALRFFRLPGCVSDTRPIETIDANLLGLQTILDYWKAGTSKVQGILNFSSSEIYGDPEAEAIPTPESYNGNVSCTGPRACYDEAKRPF